MNTKTFKYPFSIQMAKNFCQIFILLLVFLFFVMIFKNKPTDYDSLQSYYLTFLWPPIFIILSVHFIGAFSNLEVNDNELIVEFLWMKLDVPWKNIAEIKHVGSRRFGVWLIVTDGNHLTPFHRIYSLYTIGSIMPGFHVHSQLVEFDELMKLITSYRNKV